MKDVKAIVRQLVQNGAELVNEATILGVTMTNKGRICVRLDKEVDQMVADANGVYTKGTSNLVFCSASELAAAVAADARFAYMKRPLATNVALLAGVLSGAKLDVVVVAAEEGSIPANPFSERDTDPNRQPLAHDTFIYYPTKVQLGVKGVEMVRLYDQEVIRLAIQSQVAATATAMTMPVVAED